jgi:hypothetical protein
MERSGLEPPGRRNPPKGNLFRPRPEIEKVNLAPAGRDLPIRLGFTSPRFG